MYASFLINHVRLFAVPFNAIYGTLFGTHGTACTLICNDFVMEQCFANFGRAFLFDDMGRVFVPEIF
jgi:hypothetical protein